jgi:hypothetical protein
MGILMRGKAAADSARDQLAKALEDPSSTVGITAAESLAKHASQDQQRKALAFLASKADGNASGFFPALLALNVLEGLGALAEPVQGTLRSIQGPVKPPDPRLSSYVPRLLHVLTESPSAGSGGVKPKTARKPKAPQN